MEWGGAKTGDTHHLYLSLSPLLKQLSIVKYCQLKKCNIRQVGQIGIWRGGRGGNRINGFFWFAFSLDQCASPFWWMRQSIWANASVHFGEYFIWCYIFKFDVMSLCFKYWVFKTVLFTVISNILMLKLIFIFSLHVIALDSLPSPAHEHFCVLVILIILLLCLGHFYGYSEQNWNLPNGSL